MRRYKAIVFDLDDTLILEEDYIKSGFSEVAKIISYKFQMNPDKAFNDMLALHKSGSKRVFNEFLENNKLLYDNNFIELILKTYREHFPNISLLNESKEVLEWLKERNFKLGLITDGYKETQLQKIKKMNLCSVFNKIIVTDLLGRKYWKPHKLAYYVMKRSLSVKYEEMIYIGDNETKDFVTAKKLGIKTVCIKRNNAIYSNVVMNLNYKANLEIKSLKEIFNILEE